MTEADIIQIVRDGLWTTLLVSLPVLLTATGVGLVIALLQALTQIQEMTLTFVPKIIAILMTLGISLPFMMLTLRRFVDLLSDQMVSPHP